MHKACRPDKALAPHPATVVPDGATLIRPTKLQTSLKLVGRVRCLRRIRQQLCLMALRLSGLRNYRPGINLVGRIRCLRRIRQPLCLMALRLSAPTKLQNMHKACRPDKALTPHPATVVPDGATLIRPTKLQNMHKTCRPDKALTPHPAKRIRAASVSGVYLPATCSQPADKRRRPDNKSVNPAASRPDTPYSSAPY